MTEIRHRNDDGRYYKTIPIHAAPQVHEQAYNLLSKYVEAGKEVLDLGAGSGAFSSRMHDQGYKVVAADLDISAWRVSEVQSINLDLNTSFSENKLVKSQGYDVVTAIEVIEHVENPSHFLREIKKILKPDGILVFSTPNLVSLESRISLLFKGEFEVFGRGKVFANGHISLLPYWLLEDLLDKEGFEVIERCFIGQQSRRGWKKVLKYYLQFSLLPLGLRIPLEAALPVCVAFVCRPITVTTVSVQSGSSQVACSLQ